LSDVTGEFNAANISLVNFHNNFPLRFEQLTVSRFNS